MFLGRKLYNKVTVLCVAMTAMVSIVGAEDFTWTGGGDGSTWNQAGNWSPANGGNFPSFGDDARFQSDATVGGGSVDSIEIESGATLRLKTDFKIVVDQLFNNQGVITFENDDDNTLSGIDTAYKIHNPVLLNGGGQVILNGSQTGFRGGGTLINMDNVIWGSGAFDANVVNQNLIRAEGGTIQLSSGHTINNHAGQVEIESDGQIQLGVSSALQGGTLTASAGANLSGGALQDVTVSGMLNHDGTTLEDIINTGVLTLNADSRTRLEGTIDNRGTLTFIPDTLNTISGVDTAYQVHGTASLTGGGHVALQGIETGFTSAGILTNVDNTITGNGRFGLSLVNQGIIGPGSTTGDTTGLVSVNGFMEMAETSVLEFELGGFVPVSEHDVIRVFGDVELAGNLDVNVLLSFTDPISPTDTFTILESNDLTGQFNNVANGETLLTSDGRFQVQVNYGAGSAYLARHVVISNVLAVHMPEPSLFGLSCAIMPFVAMWRKRRI